MAVSPTSSNDASGPAIIPRSAETEPADPRSAYRLALARYSTARLNEIAAARGIETTGARPSTLAAELTGHLDSTSAVSPLLKQASPGAIQALSLFALTESTVWLAAGLGHALAALGVEVKPVLVELIDNGLIAVDVAGESAAPLEIPAVLDDEALAASLYLRVHPSVLSAVRVARPSGTPGAVTTNVGQIRESDGLEPILRLGAIWQRVGVEPLRTTLTDSLYKRDFERIDEDPVLSGAISDALEPIPSMPMFWLTLAHRLGLIQTAPEGDRLEATGPEFWDENAVHLPHVIATSWMRLRNWWEWAPAPGEPADTGQPLAFLRPALLLWLAGLADDEWVAIEDFAEHLRAISPTWDRLSFRTEKESSGPPGRKANGAGRSPKGGPSSSTVPQGERILRQVLLGTAYALGLVRTGEERVGRRTVVQLSPLGRYVLTMGPPPPPRPAIEHFLFVQPNLEVIAYRQGLTPRLVGRLSRFAWWTKLGAALELKLTQESTVLGLEGGLTASRMVEILSSHTQRPLPTLVPDALSRWAGQRERITFYAAATLIEFGSTEERDQAFAAWESDSPRTFIPVAERFLLVENPQKIPTDKIRTSGSRDYRHPPERCVTIEPDGVTLALDPSRSDLLIDAEIARIADELPVDRTALRASATAPQARRYVVSSGSIARAGEIGITPTQVNEWFFRRAGEAASPAIRLLLRALSPTPTVLNAKTMLVLTTPSEDMIDGLLQHPATKDLVGRRLGPTTVAVPSDRIQTLQDVLAKLELKFQIDLS